MNIKIIYKPVSLTYEQFYRSDKECFPFEPLNQESFNEMRMGNFWAAFIEDNLVGYAYVKIKTNSAHLSRIGVSKHYRKMGIANELMKIIISYCNDYGSVSIDLLVQADNPSAIKLYEKYGFKHMESSYQYIIPIHEVISKNKTTSKGKVTAIPVEDNTLLESENNSVHHENKNQNNLPNRYKLIFMDSEGKVQGRCHLDPGFPGCSTFFINEPDSYLIEALVSLEKYLNLSKEKLVLTFSDKVLKRSCSNHGFKLNYELIRMEK